MQSQIDFKKQLGTKIVFQLQVKEKRHSLIGLDKELGVDMICWLQEQEKNQTGTAQYVGLVK